MLNVYVCTGNASQMDKYIRCQNLLLNFNVHEYVNFCIKQCGVGRGVVTDIWQHSAEARNCMY